jgi:cytochrome c peroxidase
VPHPIQDEKEMALPLPEMEKKLNADPELKQQFHQVYGSDQITAQRVAQALEQFLLTLISQDSKFDSVQRGEQQFTVQEKRGFELFLTEHDPFRGLRGGDCFHCHGGPLFTLNQFINIGLPGSDAGQGAVTKLIADQGKFRTPSLRNVEITGPYMHDGRFRTLEAVIDHYDHGIQRNAQLDPNLAKHPTTGMKLRAEDKAALIAFLKTLTDRRFADR